MAEKMTLERMAQNAAFARRVGDERTADYWTEQVELANLREQSDGFTTIIADSQLLELVDSRDRPTPGLVAMVERYRERRALAEWDALKGSPEHG
jgi:hypothetical protein